MKLLHYIMNFSLVPETYIYDLINNLEYRGNDCYVLTHNRQLESERPFPKVNVVEERIFFIKTNYLISNVPFFRRVYYKFFDRLRINNKKEVYTYLDKVKPDVIHAHFGTNGVRIFNLLNLSNVDIPLVVSFHGMDINVLPKQNKKYLDFLLEMNLSKNVKFTSPSKFLKDKMVNLGFDEDKISIIPNAYNDNFDTVKRDRFFKQGEELRLLSVGRFAEVKGHKYLIKAFRKVVDYYPNSRLSLIGNGKLKGDLIALVKELGLSSNIDFLGVIEHCKLPEIFSAHDVYIQPSIRASDGAEENLSVATIEAQVSGLPCIVSNIGGLKEIVINDKTGKLVEEQNIDDLYEAIKFYIEDFNSLKEHSINARENGIKRFNKKEILSTLEELYYSIT